MSNPVKQAKRYGMTRTMVARSSAIIALFLGLAFWQALTALLPSRSPLVLSVDLGITAIILLTILSLFGSNLGDLNDRTGPTGGASVDKRYHLWRVLKDREVTLFDLLFAVPLLILNVYAQTFPEFFERDLSRLF